MGFYNKYVKADDFLQYTEEQEQEDTTDAFESPDFENLDLGEYEKWKIRESVPMHEKDNNFRRQRYKELLGVEEPNRNFPGQGSAENKRMDSLMKILLLYFIQECLNIVIHLFLALMSLL